MNNLPLINTFLMLLAAAIGGGIVAMRLRLPSLVGYIAGGILVGNVFSGYIDRHMVDMIAEAGVTLLLFTLGIEFSFHKLARILHSISWPAMAQILLSTIGVFALLVLFGVAFVPALYLAAATALSSTAVVVKLLSERGELDTVPGETATGWLVMQDLAVIPILILLSAVTHASAIDGNIVSVLSTVFFAMLKAGVCIAVVWYLGSKGVPKLLSIVAALKHRELFLLTTIGIVFLVGLGTQLVGLSVALGAFLAGLLIAETSQNHAVFAEIRPLRDLFAVVFFVSLGMALPAGVLVSYFPIIAGLSLAVILFKGSIIYGLLRFLGYHRKTAFMVGVFLTQVSEFGFIIARTGLANGALSESYASVLIAVTFITILVSGPLIARGDRVYYRMRRFLMRLPAIAKEKKSAGQTTEDDKDTGLPIHDHVVICGYGRVGKYIGRALAMSGIPFLVVDYNQHTLSEIRGSGIQTVYGDPADKDVLDFAQVDHARAVVIAIPDRHTQEMVIENVLSLNRNVKIICRTHHEADQAVLKSLGVHLIVQPEFEAAITVVSKLFANFGISREESDGKIHRLKIEHGLGNR